MYNFNISNHVLVQLIVAPRGALQLCDQNTRPVNYVDLRFLCPNIHRVYKHYLIYFMFISDAFHIGHVNMG